MSLEQKVMTDLKTAMLAKDEKSLRSLRAIKAAIILAKTSEGAGGEIGEADEIKLLQKLIKQRKDSLEIYRAQQRKDLSAKEEEEIAIDNHLGRPYRTRMAVTSHLRISFWGWVLIPTSR